MGRQHARDVNLRRERLLGDQHALPAVPAVPPRSEALRGRDPRGSRRRRLASGLRGDHRHPARPHRRSDGRDDRDRAHAGARRHHESHRDPRRRPDAIPPPRHQSSRRNDGRPGFVSRHRVPERHDEQLRDSGSPRRAGRAAPPDVGRAGLRLLDLQRQLQRRGHADPDADLESARGFVSPAPAQSELARRRRLPGPRRPQGRRALRGPRGEGPLGRPAPRPRTDARSARFSSSR